MAQDKSSCAEGPVLCQCCFPLLSCQQIPQAFSCADPTAVVVPWVCLVSLAAGVCQKHVLHLLPGMSSDSDIECDTENEEQEDATSPSEMFNQAFTVQPSSEGRVDKTPLPKHSQ